MWIQRHSGNIVRRAFEQFPAVVLCGARQTGKTSLARHLLPNADYITFDIPHHAEQARLDPERFFEKRSDPMILDEIQYVPELFRYLKILIDKKRKPGRFFMTGSQDFLMMQGLTESLAGRCAVLSLPTLSMEEVCPKADLDAVDGFCWRGGYPELWDRPNLDRELWLGSYLTTYLERDVRNITAVSSLRDFDRFLRATAQRVGQLFSMADIARDVGIAPNTVKHWLSILQSSHQVFLLEPYFANVNKRLVKTPKLYFCDTGLLLYLQGFKCMEDVLEDPAWGAAWENLVINEVRKYFLNKGERPPLYFWRTVGGLEVDLMIQTGAKRFRVLECKTAAQVKSSALKGVGELADSLGQQAILDAAVVCRTKHAYPIAPDSKCIAIPAGGSDGLADWLATRR